MPTPSRRLSVVLLPVVLVLVLLVGCGSSASVLSGEVAGDGTTIPPAADAPLVLVETKGGLAGVPIGSSSPRWVVPGAVAAPDGSAAFVADNDGDATMTTRFWRIDLRTGARSSVGEWAVPGGHPVKVFAVEPGGGRLALASFVDDRTLILPFDPATGGAVTKPIFAGHLEPEAFSLDRGLVFAARSFGDHYQVTTLDLTAATQAPTSSYDKTALPEDMYGNVVQSVLTSDRTRLVTLYRDPHSPDHTAFVHLLDLRQGVTVCVDLEAPFGTGAPGTDAIRANPDGTIDVGHRDEGGGAGVSVAIDPTAILTGEPRRHYHAHAQPDPDPPTIPTGVVATPGFVRVVALVPER